MGYAMYNGINSNLFYLRLTDHFDLEDRYHFEYYRDQNTHMPFIIAPEITSDVINEGVLQVFIPVLNNEQQRVNIGKCTETNFEEDSVKEERILANRQTVECYRQYHQILLNGVQIDPSLLRRAYHNRTNQRGAMSYVSLQDAKIGANVLTIIKSFNQETKAWTIPFQYAPTSS
jgi:hypothetical protein